MGGRPREGIQTYTKPDGKLHVRLLQHRTATGRFSGADPNMQNMPRGGTFPVKKVFVSRFDNGQILEADFAQLEFRVAALLSGELDVVTDAPVQDLDRIRASGAHKVQSTAQMQACGSDANLDLSHVKFDGSSKVLCKFIGSLRAYRMVKI